MALAREGGLGVIHRNMSIDEQVAQVASVKRSESMVITDLFTVHADTTVGELQRMMAEKGVAGFPVVSAEGKLEGIVTNRDIWFIENPDQKVREVMTERKDLITGTTGTTLDERADRYQHRIEKLPLVDAQDHLTGLITSQDIEKRKQFTNACKDENGQLRVGAAVGVGPDALERARAVVDAGADAIFIDAATGHTTRVIAVIDQIKSSLKSKW